MTTTTSMTTMTTTTTTTTTTKTTTTTNMQKATLEYKITIITVVTKDIQWDRIL